MKQVALIGVGKMGLSHLAIANQTPGIKVSAICDTSKPLLRFLEKNSKYRCFTDYKIMIRENNPDAVLICVPNAFHFEIAKYCLENGIHVFIEKPLTLSYKESKYLVDLADKKRIIGQVGYVNRFNPIFQRVKILLQSGVIGDITNYYNRMIGGVVLQKNSKGWRNDYSKGGGCLFDYGPHCFDLACYFFGANIKVLSSSLGKVFSTEVDDFVYATILHDNKILGLNYINWSDFSARRAANSIEISGTKGKLIANKLEASVFLAEGNKRIGLEKGWNIIYITEENTNVNYYLRGEDFSRQMEHFSKLLNGNIEECISPLNEALVVDSILTEIFARSGEGHCG